MIRACVLWLLLALAGPAAAAPCPPAAPPPQADAAAVDRGLLWRLTRDGRSSWLYGTMHAGRAAWALPGPVVADALRRADLLALEIDLEDPAQMRAFADALARQGAVALPAPLRERLARLAEAACLPAAALAGWPPMMQVLTLLALDGRHEGLHAEFALERVLAAVARRSGHPVHSLETAAEQLAALAPDDDTALNDRVDEALAQIEDGRSRRTLARLAQAWEQGDLTALESYERWCDCVERPADRAWMRRLLDARNPGLAQRIEALHVQGRRAFVAVGALHMTGPMALTRLLAARGFAVERLPFGP